MNWLTLLAILFLVFYFVRGWRKGFVLMIFSLIGVALIIAFATFASPYIGEVLSEHTDLEVPKIGAFIIALIIGAIILIIIRSLIQKITKLPVLKTINHILGAIISTAIGVVIIWVIMYIVSLTAAINPDGEIIGLIKESPLLNLLYENNLLIMITKQIL